MINNQTQISTTTAKHSHLQKQKMNTTQKNQHTILSRAPTSSSSSSEIRKCHLRLRISHAGRHVEGRRTEAVPELEGISDLEGVGRRLMKAFAVVVRIVRVLLAGG